MAAVDSVLVINGRAHQVWRGVAKKDLPEMHPDVMAKVVEVDPAAAPAEGALWNGERFVARTKQPVPTVKAPKRDRIAALVAALVAKGVLTEEDVAGAAEGP